MSPLTTYLLDWASLLMRWLHLIAGIAWIGASFYFVMLDNSLKRPRKPEDEARGVHGELWAVHGGGFYCSQKFLTGPQGEPLSDNLHWSKWEAYSTWLSGMGMLALVYWLGAPGTLIDARILDLDASTAVVVSLAFLLTGWIVYDLLCRSLERREGLLIGLLVLLALGADWLAHQLFAPRGAYIHVAAIRAGQAVDPRPGKVGKQRPGKVGKQRSVHNTYFTLPVLFVMLSNHYLMLFSHAHGAIVLALLMLVGVLLRQFFVLRHAHGSYWGLLASAVVILLGLIVWIAPQAAPQGEKIDLATAQSIVARHCVACHANQPTHPGFVQPPKGIVFETDLQIKSQASTIVTTVASGYMPLGNLTGMTEPERRQLLAWARDVAGTHTAPPAPAS